MSKNFNNFKKRVDSLLFEDSYVTHATMDNLKAGGISGKEELEDPDLELPIDPGPQAATQLSRNLPPVDDPEYAPVNSKELADALSALATDLPDKTDVVQKTYEKFKKFVDDSQDEGIKTMEKETSLEEARAIIKNQLLIDMLSEALDDTDAYGNRYDDDPLGDLDGPSDDELEDMERPAPKADPLKDESTLADLAKEMGLSTSGIKRIEAEAIRNLQLVKKHFPDDFKSVREMAMNFYAKGLYDLELIDAEESADLMGSPYAYELASFRQFMWSSFLNNVHKKMLRDANAQGIDPDNLGDLTPGLFDRAKDYFTRLPETKKMKDLVTSLGVAE